MTDTSGPATTPTTPAQSRADVLGDLPQTRQELEALIRQIVLEEVQRAAEQLEQKLAQAAAVHALDTVGTKAPPSAQ